MKWGHRVSIPNFIYFKTPLFSMVFRVRGVHSAPIPHQFFGSAPIFQLARLVFCSNCLMALERDASVTWT